MFIFFPALHASNAGKDGHTAVDASELSTAPAFGESFRLPAGGTLLAEYTFDAGTYCDTEGWTSIDRTIQPGPYFHVDDFNGLGSLVPLDSSQSMWCGARPDPMDPILCSYATLPGYGNNWEQMFESITFSTTGNVTISCMLRYDSESDHDKTTLEYLHKDGTWRELLSLSGSSDSLVTALIPGGDVDGNTKVRFRFVSGGGWSDEDGLWNTDGAVIIDNLAVTDDTGPVSFQDFESESPGDLSTADGHWTATVPAPYGDYAFINNNASALDPSITNPTCVWAFTNGSTDDYTCGGYPYTIAVPYGNTRDQYIYNEVRSPAIPMSPGGSAVYLQFDVYHDLAASSSVYYYWSVRYRTGTCWSAWQDRNFFYNGTEKKWVGRQEYLSDLLGDLSTIDEMQIALGVVDMCGAGWGDCVCHSNAPLFDNVRLFRIDPGHITGKVYSDVNGNCVYDEGLDFGICNRRVRAVSAYGHAAYTDGQGNYSITVPEAMYTVDLVTFAGDPWTVRSCPTNPPYTVDVVAGGTYPDNDFRLVTVEPPACDVSVGIISNAFNYGNPPCHNTRLTTPCPGIEHEYLFWVRNDPLSTMATTPDQLLYIDLDPAFTIASVFSTDPVNCPITVTGSPTAYQREIELDARCVPGQYYVVGVRATPATSGTYVTQVTYADLGECSGDKTHSISESDMCSCDPNAKSVTPVGCGPHGNVAMDERLTYKIRFENVGSGIAHNIVIEDQLDTDLDEASAAVVSSSHAVTGVQLDPGNLLKIYFDGVNLPGAGDPDNNHGFLIFAANPKQGLSQGTLIHNTAEIIFDFNTPVVTNTTENMLLVDPCPSTAVHLISFSALGRDGYVELKWATSSEPGNAGFNLYRSEGEEGAKTKLNDGLIPAAGDELRGSEYSFRDYYVAAGASYCYWFEDVSVDGAARVNGPVLVEGRDIPTAFGLAQNVPNPFNPVTEIRFAIAAGCHVRLEIYDVLGKRVRTLIDGREKAGYRSALWDGRNDEGVDVSSGVYFYRLEAGGFTDTKKMILLR